MLRSIAAPICTGASTSAIALRCVSKHGPPHSGRLHPSRRAHASPILPYQRSARAPQDEGGAHMKPAIERFNLAGQMPLISLIILCAVTALLTDRFLSPLNLTNILVQSSIMAVIAMGMTFVIVGGGFDLSVGSTAALAGC